MGGFFSGLFGWGYDWLFTKSREDYKIHSSRVFNPQLGEVELSDNQLAVRGVMMRIEKDSIWVWGQNVLAKYSFDEDTVFKVGAILGLSPLDLFRKSRFDAYSIDYNLEISDLRDSKRAYSKESVDLQTFKKMTRAGTPIYMIFKPNSTSIIKSIVIK